MTDETDHATDSSNEPAADAAGESGGEASDQPEDEQRLGLEFHDVQFKLPPDASADEAAAIAAAIGVRLQDERDGDATETESDWHGQRFRFAGRFESLTGTRRRIPANAPTDKWTALGRLEGL